MEGLVDISLEEGNSLCLAAKVSGSPEPDVKWMKDKKNITEDYRRKFENSKDGEFRLVIKSAKVKDSGEYSLTAKNSIGETSCKADIKVALPER